MANYKDSAFNKIQNNLFRSQDEIKEKFSERELQRKARIMFCVSKKMDDPLVTDKELVEFLTSGCEGTLQGVSLSTAYRDIAAVTRITGNVNLAAKNWYRYMLVEGGKRGAALAEKINDPKGMAANFNIIGKYTQADKDDIENHLEKMIPFEPVITDDPSVLGDDIELIDDVDQKRKELREFFNKKTVTDIHYEELKDEETI